MRTHHLLVTLALLAALPACRKLGSCPVGQEETKVADDKYWCHDRAAKKSVFVQLHPGTRQFRQRCHFEQGLLHGPFEAAHASGDRWVEGAYRGGAAAGKWVQWNPAGQKVAEAEYRGGRLVSGAPVAMAAICEAIPRVM